MILSFFSLISSVHKRLLEAMLDLSQTDTSPHDIHIASRLVVWAASARGPSDDVYTKSAIDNDMSLTMDDLARIKLSWRSIAMVYLWQTSMMLMSWSWVAFLVGLTLHVIRVLLPWDPANADNKVHSHGFDVYVRFPNAAVDCRYLPYHHSPCSIQSLRLCSPGQDGR
jgi:hypothetical protein